MDSLAALVETVSTCEKCDLCKTRTHAVIQKSIDTTACFMIVMKAPREQEDKQGEPHMHPALLRLLGTLGVGAQHVYMTHAIKCHTPADRDPKAEETTACEEHLHAQIRLIKPKAILAIGRASLVALLGKKEPVKVLRAETHFYEKDDIKVPVFPTYHPDICVSRAKEGSKDWLRALVEDVQQCCQLVTHQRIQPVQKGSFVLDKSFSTPYTRYHVVLCQLCQSWSHQDTRDEKAVCPECGAQADMSSIQPPQED